jgi:uncharacterized protein (TIGR04141 family)
VDQKYRGRSVPFREIPVDKSDPKDYRVVFAIFGADPDDPGEGLPFFSQLNLIRNYEALLALGYDVGVIGLPTEA